MTEEAAATPNDREDDEWSRKLRALIAAKKSTLSPSEFQKTINVVFHDVEAAVYDRLHAEMWQSLTPVVDKLSLDVLRVRPGHGSLALADVGCGTGLATTLFLNGPLGARIAHVDLLDTSTEMLARCKDRAASWAKSTAFFHGGIECLPDRSTDVIVVSSVLHHIPDIAAFCSHVARVLRANGVLIHLQDPASGRGGSEVLAERKRALARRYWAFAWRRWPRPLRLPFTLMVRLRQWSDDAYLREINRRLIRDGVVKVRLTNAELWSVTDTHVDDLPYATGEGISEGLLRRSLPGFREVSWRTYGFFGELGSRIPPRFRSEESALFDAHDQHGAFVAGVWSAPPHREHVG